MLVSLPENNVAQTSHAVPNAFSRCVTAQFDEPMAPVQLTFLREQPSALESIDEGVPDNHQRFSHLLSIMPAGVLVVDKKGMVSLANQQAINLLGEPLIGEAWRNVISRVFAPKDDDGHEVSMINGKKVKIDISPLTEEKGQLIVITDLTETRELQSRVGHMQRLSSLGKMVASLAHQVRTPLSSALLYAENLKSMPLHNEMASRFSEKLTLRLKELEAQVNDMLLFAKSSDKQIVSSINTLEVMHQAIAQTEAQVKQANITLNTSIKHSSDCSQETSPVNSHFILGNLTAVTGAITNLISNAMQALEQQRNTHNLHDRKENTLAAPNIHVCVSNKYENEQSYCVFTVADNGTGITASDIKRMFEPFYTTKSQGTGLGLAVVSTVAKSHKGFVKCGNTEDGGAYFSLYIPSHQPNFETMPTTHIDTANMNDLSANKNASTGVPHE